MSFVMFLRSSLYRIKRSPLICSLRRMDRLLLGTVVVPTSLAVLYFGLIASDVYISESQFIIRSPQQQTGFLLGDMLKGAGFTRSQDDSYTVQDFMLSRDALGGLEKDFHVKEAFSEDFIDSFSRFASFGWDHSLERFYRYYKNNIVDVQIDSFSSIATLTVRAFTAEESARVNERLLEMGEDLVNDLNKRAQQDLIAFTKKEVADAQERARAAAVKLADYRNEKGVLDPEKESVIPQQSIAKLEGDLTTANLAIEQLERLAKDNPQLPSLRHRAVFLKHEIETKRSTIAGSGDKSLASKASDYRQLALEKDVSDKILAGALSSLEQARDEARRQQQYLERVVQPSYPDKSMEPRRLRAILAVFLLGLVAWGILTMLIAGIREHQD